MKDFINNQNGLWKIALVLWSFSGPLHLTGYLMDRWQHRIDNPVVRDRELEKWECWKSTFSPSSHVWVQIDSNCKEYHEVYHDEKWIKK